MLVVVLVVTGLATWLLIRTLDAAAGIDDSANEIALDGRGIDIATDSVIQLRRTNRIARSILESAQPLDRQLVVIANEARSIDATAMDIDATANAIDQTARGINSTAATINVRAEDIDATADRILVTARDINSVAATIETRADGINAEAAEILDVARQIDDDVRLINTNLNRSIVLSGRIESDTSDILARVRQTHQTSACIDSRLTATSDGHCETKRGQADGDGRP